MIGFRTVDGIGKSKQQHRTVAQVGQAAIGAGRRAMMRSAVAGVPAAALRRGFDEKADRPLVRDPRFDHIQGRAVDERI